MLFNYALYIFFIHFFLQARAKVLVYYAIYIAWVICNLQFDWFIGFNHCFYLEY